MRKECRGIVACLLVALAWASPAAAQEQVAGELDRLAETIKTAPHTAVALSAAHSLESYRLYVTPEDYAARLTVLSEAVNEPLVEFVLQRQIARALRETGATELASNQGFAAAQSCLVDWQLVGPFENASMQGFYDALGPERGEVGPYQGRLSEVDWRPLSSEASSFCSEAGADNSSHHLCAFFLNSRVHPSTSAAVYLATTVTSEQARAAQLLIGSQGAYRVWVNGKPVAQRTGELGLGIDAEGWEVELERGENEILLKLASTGQGGLSFMARLVDEDARPLQNIATRATRPTLSVAPFEEAMWPVAGVWPLLEDGANQSQPVAVQLGAAKLWQAVFGDDPATPWRDVADRLMESSLRKFSARDLVHLAELFEEHWQRQALFDQAVTRSGGDPLVRWKRARERGEGLTYLEWSAQRRELLELVAEHPRFLMAIDSLARWYERHDTGALALPLVEKFDAPEREQTPAWVRLAAELNERHGDKRRAAELRHKAAQVHALSGTFGWQLIREDAARGDFDQAVRRTCAYRQLSPWNRSWPLQLAQLLRARGDVDGALEQIDQLIAEAPGDTALFERRAELLVARGDVDGAMATIEQAIALRPQATRLQEYLEHLQPESDRFYEPWIVTELREIADQTPAGSFNFDHIVDQRVHQVASNGLARQYVQRAHRVIRNEGIAQARAIRVTHRQGDERVEVVGVRVYKPDGTVSEDFSQWRTGDSQKRTTTYNDSVYLNLRANNVDVGDIVEFQYVVHQVANENFRGDYFGSVAYLQRGQPLAFFRYAVIYPESWELFFREPTLEHRRFDGQLPNGEPLSGRRVTAFELRDLPRVISESDQPGFSDVYDHIIVSNKEHFDEIGRWWWNLVEEQLVVDDAIRQQVAQLTGHLESKAAKVEAIYDFVARNTRYLHVGLGIHGWKPYRTSTIFRNRYGDCKDKSALLKVMLEEAGIEAHLALVRTRRLGAVGEYPASMHIFNHAVTYVPSMDLFLDATAEFNGPYELTSMDQGAQALIVYSGERTEWVTMPVDEPDQNLLRNELEIDLTGDVPVMSGRMVAYGVHAVRFRRTLEDAERRDEVFERQLAGTYPGARLIEARYRDLDNLHAPTIIEYTAEVPGILRGGEDGQFIHPLGSSQNMLGRYARESSRHQDRTFRVPTANEMNLRYRLPAGTALERIPENTQVESPFGELHVEYSRHGEELVVDVRYTIAVQRVSVADYTEFRRFVGQMHEALNETIRLLDEEGRR